MPIKYIDRYTEGFEFIIEAEDRHFLLGGRQIGREGVAVYWDGVVVWCACP
jgi:hypothetical protein